jgi:SAM-dependent methyltransferase
MGFVYKENMRDERPWQLRMFDKTLKKKMKIEHLKVHLGPLEGKNCFMVTCGDNNGAMNYHLRNAGGKWTWADFEETAVNQIEELLKEPVTPLDKHRCSIPFSDESFDCVVVIDCHEHLVDPLPFTKELWRITKKGGKIVVSVPNGDEDMLGVKIKNWIGMTKEKYGHIVTGYDIPELGELLQKANLTPVASKSYSKFFTEMLELIVNFAYVMILSKRGDVKVEEGTIAPSTKDQLKSVEKTYKFYRLVYPVFRLISTLDALLFLTKGYAVVMEARKE